jgi:PhzF family phenazine biosynthesis protein
MHVHALRCFGAAPGHGNVALVVEQGPTTSSARQAFATEQNKSACVFLDQPADGESWQVDYYYPHARSPLCLHATLAAAAVLIPRGHTQLVTSMRQQPVKLRHEGSLIFVGVRKQPVAPLGIDPWLPAQLLGEPDLRLASAPLLSSVGSPKLLIEVGNSATLHALRPRLDRITDWSKQHGVSGCYVYCRVGDDVYEGRNFNHADPALEDSATGVAAGALSAWLGRGLTMLQGHMLGNPCRIATTLEGSDIFVGGACEQAAVQGAAPSQGI